MDGEQERVLEFITRQAQGIAKMFGTNCETLVHDMSQQGHPIVAIFNGHVSGRQVGSTTDIFGGVTSPSSEEEGKPIPILRRDYVNTQVVTNTGRFIKSSTFNYVGEGFHYALGINFDYTPLTGAYRMITELSNVDIQLETAMVNESISQIDEIFDACVAVINKPVAAMKKADRLQLVALLEQKKAFNFQRAVSYVAEKLGVSRYTIYKYQHEVEERRKG